jgi:SAM-dependent methyltransferase
MPDISKVPDLQKAALRGEPSYVWRAGQERRLGMIRRWGADSLGGVILENGCGTGEYLMRLHAGATLAVGLEIEFERALQAKTKSPNLICAAGEHLPFRAGTFDLVLSNEVLEHVADDRLSAAEMARTLKDGCRMLLFCPNRGYPFETHGIYWRGGYRFGNIPLVNYLPRRMRDRLAPHVRAYSTGDLAKLLAGLPVTVSYRTIIFGAYDNLIQRAPGIERLVRAILQSLEHTPLRVLGLSHFQVLVKTDRVF